MKNAVLVLKATFETRYTPVLGNGVVNHKYVYMNVIAHLFIVQELSTTFIYNK